MNDVSNTYAIIAGNERRFVDEAGLDAACKELASFGALTIWLRDQNGNKTCLLENGKPVRTDKPVQVQLAPKHDHDHILRASEAVKELVSLVKAEARRDIQITAGDLSKHISLTTGKISAFGMKLTMQAIRGLFFRLESPATGYVFGLNDRMIEADRKGNQAAKDADRQWMLETIQFELSRQSDKKLLLRLRESAGNIFAVLSPSYENADITTIYPEILAAIPETANGSFAYDPGSTGWDVRINLNRSDAIDKVVGEPVSAFASLQSRDNGTKAFAGYGGLLILACQNGMTYAAKTKATRRVHKSGIQYDIPNILAATGESVATLAKAYGAGRYHVVPSIGNEAECVRGYYAWLLRDRRSELQGIIPGRFNDHAPDMVHAFQEQRRNGSQITRADLMNGLTKFVQRESSVVRRDAEAAIGKWLVGNGRLECEAKEEVEV
jgi:hypothetical protein